MSRTLDLTNVSKAQKAIKAWELLQEEQQKSTKYPKLNEISTKIRPEQAADETDEARSSSRAS
ncbi:MAG: hypothetical protein ACFCUL_12140 [Flavobacteriaceae bacterium]